MTDDELTAEATDIASRLNPHRAFAAAAFVESLCADIKSGIERRMVNARKLLWSFIMKERDKVMVNN